MAISKKGLRKIVVDENTYYWKFNELVYVFNESDPNNFLSIDFGWYDEWLYVNDKENAPPDYHPKTVTPGFVAGAIRFALNVGRDERKMKLSYREGAFGVDKKA